jgi:hypothetical protein
VSFNDYDKRFYGIYPGKCVENVDPEDKYRIKLQVPQIYGTAISNWAFPCTPVADDRSVFIPGLNSTVWVMFIGGDPDFPVWIGVL